MHKNAVKIMQYSYTGEVRYGGFETILNSGTIGSCVAITEFEPVNNI